MGKIPANAAMTFKKRQPQKIKAVLEPYIILFLGGLVV
jgi:hypothetical protein